MIAADTSAWISYLKGSNSNACARLEEALSRGILGLPLPVFMELLSFPAITEHDRQLIRSLPHLPLQEGYWERAAQLRAGVLKRGLRARSLDTLIAQACIDVGAPLITEDGDFRHFSKAGLKLL